MSGDDGDRWSEADELLITGYYSQARRSLEDERSGASGSWSAAEEMTFHAKMAAVAHRMGRYDDMIEHTDAGLALARPALGLQMTQLHAWASIAWTMRGRATQAQQSIDEAKALTVGLGAEPAASRVRSLVFRALGNLRATGGRLREAVEAAEASMSAAEESGDATMIALARAGVGEAHALVGQHASAMRFLDVAERDLAALGDRWGLTYVQRSKLRIFLDRGQVEEALAAVEEGMTTARDLEDPKLLAMIEIEYGRLLQRAGDFATAASLAEAALHRARQCGARPEEIAAVVLAGHVALARGKNEEAVEFADLALREAEDAHLYPELAASQRLAALALARCGRIEDANTALDFMMPLVKALGNPYRRLEVEIARIEVDFAEGSSREDLVPRLDQLTNRALAIQAAWQSTVIDRLRERIVGC